MEPAGLEPATSGLQRPLRAPVGVHDWLETWAFCVPAPASAHHFPRDLTQVLTQESGTGRGENEELTHRRQADKEEDWTTEGPCRGMAASGTS